jgi:hypothetical protein
MSSLSVIVDIRCSNRADALVRSTRDVALSVLTNYIVAAAANSMASQRRQQGRTPPAAVSFTQITTSGPMTGLPLTAIDASPQVLASVTARLTAAGHVAPTPLSAASLDPLVLQALAVRNAVDAAAVVTAAEPQGHVILLVTTLGPSTNTPALARLLPPPPAGSGTPATLTICLVQPPGMSSVPHPHARLAGAGFLSPLVRVVRPNADRRSLQRLLGPVVSAGLGLVRSASVRLRLGTGFGDDHYVALDVSSCALVDEDVSDYCRNSLVSADNSDPRAPKVLELVAVTAADSVSEAWLSGVPAIGRVAAIPDAAESARSGAALSALTAELRSRSAVAICRTSAATPLRCTLRGVPPFVEARPTFLLLPWARDGSCVLLRQLIPAELRRVDAGERRSVDKGDVPPTLSDDEYADVAKAVSERVAALQAVQCDLATVDDGVLLSSLLALASSHPACPSVQPSAAAGVDPDAENVLTNAPVVTGAHRPMHLTDASRSHGNLVAPSTRGDPKPRQSTTLHAVLRARAAADHYNAL